MLHKLEVVVCRKLTCLEAVLDLQEVNHAEKHCQLHRMQRRSNKRSKVLKAVVSSGRQFSNLLSYKMYRWQDCSTLHVICIKTLASLCKTAINNDGKAIKKHHCEQREKFIVIFWYTIQILDGLNFH